MKLKFPLKSAVLSRRILPPLLCTAMGFVLGVALAPLLWTGCRAKDLTTEPDSSFLQAPVPNTTVSEAPPPPILPEKWVCLTFDDGPSKTTPKVLDVLKAEGVPATFFVVATGYNNDHLPLIRRAVREGHQIAFHSASHEYKQIYRSDTAYWEDIALLKERITPYVDVESIRCLRFPGGSTNTVSRKYGGKELMQTLKSQAEEKGLHWFDWNVCAEDAVGGHPSADKIFRNIVRETGEQTECIVLMHDSATTGTTAEALPDIIGWYRENDYEFCTLEQILAAKGMDASSQNSNSP